MKYISTRNASLKVSASQAIISGLAPDGGLFLPESIPTVTPQFIEQLADMDYAARAAAVLGLFLDDFSAQELSDFTAAAYSAAKFPVAGTAPVVKVGDSAYILELFHGPTCAFKDFALQMLPYLLTASLRKNGVDKTVMILVATSGDTGKAALEGFAGVPGTKICVFYPHGGTSNIQRLQMTTQSGDNVMVAAVEGNFDDAQNGVKAIFTDSAYAQELAMHNCILSSANSINWGRLVPQIAYYFSAYCDLLRSGVVKMGDKINVTVPTGNFGNILAAYYARACGLPIGRLICASNRNRVLTDFIRSGVYDKNRPFYLTSSPSMDILISSNLERLLYLLCGGDVELRQLMSALQTEGKYQISGQMLENLQAVFYGGCADEAATAASIQSLYAKSGYLCDPHTAVGVHVYQEYLAASKDSTPTVIDATASPFKFCGSVLSALGQTAATDDFAMFEQIAQASGQAVPSQLAELKHKAERFTQVVQPTEMKAVVSAFAAR